MSLTMVPFTLLLSLALVLILLLSAPTIIPVSASLSTTTASSTASSSSSTTASLYQKNDKVRHRNLNLDHSSIKRNIQLLPYTRGGANTNTVTNTVTNTNTVRAKTIATPRRSTTTNVHKPPQIIKKINPHYAVLYGMVLALNAGFMNGITLSGLLSTSSSSSSTTSSSSIKQASSAVTGAWTNSALSYASSSTDGFWNFNLKCILSYMSGSFIAGVCNPFPMNYSMKKYTVAPCFFIASLFMYLATLLLVSSNNNNNSSSNWILCLLVANGIQNSISSSLTSNLMRTSHYSGITSDIGTYIGQTVRGNKTNGIKLKVFVVLATCFWIGGYVSFGLVDKFGNWSLMFSSVLYLMFGLFSL